MHYFNYNVNLNKKNAKNNILLVKSTPPRNFKHTYLVCFRLYRSCHRNIFFLSANQ